MEQLTKRLDDIQVIRSGRKTMALEVRADQTVVVRAPYRMPVAEIRRFVREKSDWIEKQLCRMGERNAYMEENAIVPMSEEELRELVRAALEDIPARVKRFAPLVGVSYGRITIRNQTTRWGSCSGKGNLNFNCLLMLTPEAIRDYVVVHELCHRLEMNHSSRFWAQVERILPDYRQCRSWLKENGGSVMSRNPANRRM